MTARNLHDACLFGENEFIQEAIDSGESLDRQARWTCWTGLRLASFHGHHKTVQLLIEGGCDINKKSPLEGETPFLYNDVIENYADKSALDYACYCNHGVIVQILVDAGACLSDHPMVESAVENNKERRMGVNDALTEMRWKKDLINEILPFLFPAL